MSDLADRIRGVYDFYKYWGDPNIYEFMTLQNECIKESEETREEERDYIEEYKKYYSFVLDFLNASHYSSTLNALLGHYDRNVYVGPVVDENDFEGVRKLAACYDYINKCKGPNLIFDNLEDVFTIAAKIGGYQERATLPNYFTQALEEFKEYYDPSGKIDCLINTDAAPNIFETVTLLTTTHLQSDNNRANRTDALKRLGEVVNRKLKNGKVENEEFFPLCSTIDKLVGNLDSGYTFSGSQIDLLVMVSKVYFYIREQVRDRGESFTHDNIGEFNNILDLYTRVESTLDSSPEMANLWPNITIMKEYISGKMVQINKQQTNIK